MAEPFNRDDEARELFDQGMGRNEIAKALGVGAATITRWAARAGVAFDRSQTELAVRARVIDIRESRTLLTQKALQVAHDKLDELDGPYLVYNFGGRDNTYEEHLLDNAPADVVRTIMSVVRDAHVMSSKTLESTPSGVEEAESVLDRLEAEFDAEFTDADDAEFQVSQ